MGGIYIEQTYSSNKNEDKVYKTIHTTCMETAQNSGHQPRKVQSLGHDHNQQILSISLISELAYQNASQRAFQRNCHHIEVSM